MRRCGALRLYFHNIYIYIYTYIKLYIYIYNIISKIYVYYMYVPPTCRFFQIPCFKTTLFVSMLVMADLEAFSCHIAETS